MLLLLIVSAVVYLPFVSGMGLMNDDWYLIFAGKAGGKQVYSTVFSSDRPLRAFVMGPAYFLFGDRVILYHASAYLFRFLSGVCVYWLFQMIWRNNRTANLLIAVLFMIYPGFLSQTNPIDYQSQLLGLFLATLSLALTIKAILSSGGLKVLFVLLSILTGIFYLGLVEYFLGFEAFRIISIYLFNYYRSEKESSARTWLTTFKQWLPSAIIPVGFMAWRLFLFESERRATDLGAQLQVIAESPIVNSLWLGVYLLQDSLSAAFLAWGTPLYLIAGDLRLRQHLLSFGLAAVVVAGFLWVTRYFNEQGESKQEKVDWQIASISAGIGFVILSLVPVILVNRRLSFEYYSRYALASALGSAMILAGLIYLVSNKKMRDAFLAFLILVATLTHFHNSARAAAETAAMKNFWWQVSWRVPAFQPEATLIANYPITAVGEDYFVWGPANLLYYPASTSDEKIKPLLYAVVLTQGNLLDILKGGQRQTIERRGITTYPDLANILILSQPTLSSCVHVIDGKFPVVSTNERPDIVSASSHSNISLVDLNAQESVPPASIFGSEPERGWCFYFQKASLASQREDWQVVADLGNEAWKKDFRPLDKSEWLVFLDAYARLNQLENVTKITKDFKQDDFQTFLFCQNLKNRVDYSSLTAEMQNLLRISFCGNN